MVSIGMRCFGVLAIVLLGSSPAFAQTMLEQVRMRGAAAAQDFDDDPENALPTVPWTIETSTLSILGIDTGLARLSGGQLNEHKLGIGGAGRLYHSELEQPRVAGLWGQSWAVALDAEFGAESTRYFGCGNALAQFGTLATLGAAGHAFFLRFSGEMSVFRDSVNSMGTGFAGIPVGLRFKLAEADFEVSAVPALGWATLFQDAQPFVAGPLFMGAQLKWLTKPGFIELQHMRGVSPAQAAITTLLTCAYSGYFALCAEGTWLALHDLGQGDQARFARVGVRIGLGTSSRNSERSLRPSIVPLR